MLEGDMIFLVWMSGIVFAYLLGSHEGRINLIKDLIAGKSTRVGNMMVNAESVKVSKEDVS